MHCDTQISCSVYMYPSWKQFKCVIIIKGGIDLDIYWGYQEIRKPQGDYKQIARWFMYYSWWSKSNHFVLNKIILTLQVFQAHSTERRFLHFDSNFIEVCSPVSNWQGVISGSGNGLAPNRRQAITWTTDDLVYWHMYPSAGGHFKNVYELLNLKSS